jgi:hypothetical protein
MAEDPRQKAARIAREAFARDPSLIKEFMPKLQSVGVDPALGAPEGWSLPDTGTLTADDIAAPWNGPAAARTTRGAPAPLSPSDPAWKTPAQTEQEWRAGRERERASPPAWEPPYAPGALPSLEESDRRIEDYRESERAKAFSAMPPPPSSPPYDPLTSPRAPSMPMPSVTATANQGPPSPAVGSYAGGFMRSPALPQARPPIESLPVADIFSGGGAGPPPPGLPRPRPMDSLIAGRPDAPLGGMPAPPQFAGNMPQPRPEQQFAGNMPRPRPEDAGMATARLPLPRPDMPQDVAARPPLIDPGRFGAVPPSPAASPLSVRQGLRIPDDASMPPGLQPPVRTGFGNEALNIDPATGLPAMPGQQVAQQTPTPAPIDPAAIEEARRTLQMHPDTGRIRTAPGLTQFNEPARLPPTAEQAARPLIRPDLTQAAANYKPPAPVPRPRPPEEAVTALVPQSGLPASVMESIRASYNPTASGGPAVPQTPEEEAARRALIAKLQGAEEQIAGPPASVPPPASVSPIEPVTLGASAPETAGMSTPAPLIAPPVSSINPNLSQKEIERRARERGFGTVENLTGDRWARGIGAGAGIAAGLATGNPLAAVGLGVQGFRRGDDVRRNYMNRTGFAGFLGNIFGGGRKKTRKDEDKDAPLPKDPAGIKEAAAAGSRGGGSGLGSDRGGYGGMGSGSYGYGGAPYPGYGGYGGGYGPDSIGGAYRNR